jgi:hypothetical protein
MDLRSRFGDPSERDQGLLARTWMLRGNLIQQLADLRMPGAAECHGQLMRDAIASGHQCRCSAFHGPIRFPQGSVTGPIELPRKTQEFERAAGK